MAGAGIYQPILGNAIFEELGKFYRHFDEIGKKMICCIHDDPHRPLNWDNQRARLLNRT